MAEAPRGPGARRLTVRDALAAFGVEPRELEHAVAESRHFVRRASATARLASAGLAKLGAKAPAGSKSQIVALLGSEWLGQLAEETDAMLRQRGRR